MFGQVNLKSDKYLVHPGGYQFDEMLGRSLYILYRYVGTCKPKRYPVLRTKQGLLQLLAAIDPKVISLDRKKEIKKDILNEKFHFEFNRALDGMPIGKLKNDTTVFWIRDKRDRLYQAYYVNAGKAI
jgi:hypothetical protein